MNCDHKGCRCRETAFEQAGKNFCCERCAEAEAAGGESLLGCGCGHPECAAV